MIAICPNPYRDAELKYTLRAYNLLSEQGFACAVCPVFAEEGDAILPPKVVYTPIASLGDDCTLLIVIGGDGTILQISRYAAGKGSVFGSSSDGEWEAYRFAAADVNGDGLVNSRDALQISRYAAGKSSQFDQKD